jgi:hypothetical protein
MTARRGGNGARFSFFRGSSSEPAVPGRTPRITGKIVVQNILRITLVAGLFSVTSTGVQAGFVWVDNQWRITKLTASAADIGSAASAFGADATMNGEIKNEKADVAVAKAVAQTIADPNAASDSDAAVEFERKFQLVGPPNDWIVTLFGTLSGAMHANSSDNNVNASSHALGTAFIADNQGNILFRIGGAGTAWDRSIKANTNLPLLSPMTNVMQLPNGNYTIEGLLEVESHVDQGLLAIASSDADFFNTLFVGLQVAPVPEPSALALVAVGLAWVLWHSRRMKAMGTKL